MAACWEESCNISGAWPHCNCGSRDHSLLCSVIQPQCTQPRIRLTFSAGLLQCPALSSAAHCHLSCPGFVCCGLTQWGALFSKLELLFYVCSVFSLFTYSCWFLNFHFLLCFLFFSASIFWVAQDPKPGHVGPFPGQKMSRFHTQLCIFMYVFTVFLHMW